MKKLALLIIAVLAMTACGNSPAAQCHSICDRQAAANCSGFSATSCNSSCDTPNDAGASTVCVNESNALASCLATATYTCSAANTPTTSSCDTQSAALVTCAFQQLSDAGHD